MQTNQGSALSWINNRGRGESISPHDPLDKPDELLELLIGRFGFDGLLFKISRILEEFGREGVGESMKFAQAAKKVERLAKNIRNLNLFC